MDNNRIIDIDTIVSESEINVINTMFDYYNKAYLFIENYDGDIENCCDILQEQLIIESCVAKNETKNKKSILKQLLNLVKKLCRKAINIIKNIIHKNRSTNSTNFNNVSKPQIKEPVDIGDIIELTDAILNIDIFNHNIDLDRFSDELHAIMSKDGGMISINQLDNKMEKVAEIIKRIEAKIDDINKQVDEEDNFNDDGYNISWLYNLCQILKKLLSYYINITNDINSKIKESMSSNDNVIDDKYKMGDYCVVYKKGKDEPMNPELEDKIFKLGIICRSTNKYDEYKQAYDELCDILGFHKDAIFKSGCSSMSALKKGYFNWYSGSLRETATITLKPGTKLYHTSTQKGLTELKPSFRAIGGIDFNDPIDVATNSDTMYPTQRVYFFLKNPGGRFDTNNAKKYKPRKGEYVYEYAINGPMKVKVDTEAAYGSYRKAVFIETDIPIPVKDVTDEFKD